ncbi:MAG TPA: hypothetical protein VEL51_06395 [Vicinamibacterales bacterium]|nr:hypothetical protein [Vicinamibacterales bacterium]
MRSNHLFVTFLIAGALICAPAGASAQGHGRGHAKADKPHKGEHAHRSDRHADEHDVVIDRDGHVRAIHEYARAGSLPPGLAKRESLPPGLRKQLQERGELPPGLQKRLVPVPAPLLARLPAVPGYYQRYFAGDDLVVVNTRTNRIAAVIPDVWR